jgi:hypothetical protein
MLRKYLKLEEDYLVNFGRNTQKGALMARIKILPFWNKLTYGQKLRAVLTRNWRPTNEDMENAAQDIFLREVFGKEADFGNVLYNLNLLHHHRDWELGNLTDGDQEKFEGLQSLRMLLTMKNWEMTSDYLHLSLWEFSPQMCVNLIPISFYIPVTSIKYCLELQENYTFNSVRACGHPLADDLIGYLYDVLFIQQKIAANFYNLITLMDKVRQEKADAILMTHEVDALTICDNNINYLKATVEKTILLLALIFEIKNLDGLKRHQQKLSALDKKIPPKVKDRPYFQFVWEQIQSDSISELNNLRSGINHKRGVTKLQPHSFINKSFEETALWEQFSILKKQHQLNTLTLVGVLAIMADDLVARKPPTSVDEQYLEELITLGTPAYEKIVAMAVEE